MNFISFDLIKGHETQKFLVEISMVEEKKNLKL
jgi:hypothetical protein